MFFNLTFLIFLWYIFLIFLWYNISKLTKYYFNVQENSEKWRMMWTKMILERPLQARPYLKASFHMGKSKLIHLKLCANNLRFDNDEVRNYVSIRVFLVWFILCKERFSYISLLHKLKFVLMIINCEIIFISRIVNLLVNMIILNLRDENKKQIWYEKIILSVIILTKFNSEWKRKITL